MTRAEEMVHYRITIDVVAKSDGVNRCRDIEHHLYMIENQLVPYTVREEDVKYKVELLSIDAEGQITEDYSSFEIAKLLKEKGFDEECQQYYGDYKYPCPTLQMTMKWLSEKHNILLVVDYEYECDSTPYYFKIYRLGENGKPEKVAIKGVSYDKDDNAIEHIVGYRDWERSKGDYSNYEQACEAGIRYCLEKLI